MKNSILYVTFFILCFILTSQSKKNETSLIDNQVIGDVFLKNKQKFYFIDTTEKIKEITKKNTHVYQLKISLESKPSIELANHIEIIKRNEGSIVIIVGDNNYVLERYGKWLSDYFSIDTYYLSSPDELNRLLKSP